MARSMDCVVFYFGQKEGASKNDRKFLLFLTRKKGYIVKILTMVLTVYLLAGCYNQGKGRRQKFMDAAA
jgi:hypothetical protein